MAPENNVFTALRRCWSATTDAGDNDYTLLESVGESWAARSRAGLAALVIPLHAVGASAVGRRSSGCELLAHPSLRFVHEAQTWQGPAAALVCTDPDLVDAFAVLATDVARRADADASWQSLLAVVEEWQTLLAPRGRPSTERELGIWGELWFLDQSEALDLLLVGWRGPEGDPTDFFVAGVAAEVKASRVRRQHHVSQAQVDAPIGSGEAWLVSLHVKVDPGARSTVPSLAESILARASDPTDAMRRIARAGYTANDRREYTNGFALVLEPEWYPIASVPRVRTADPGVSHLRYRVSLDERLRADAATTDRLVQHFHGTKES